MWDEDLTWTNPVTVLGPCPLIIQHLAKQTTYHHLGRKAQPFATQVLCSTKGTEEQVSICNGHLWDWTHHPRLGNTIWTIPRRQTPLLLGADDSWLQPLLCCCVLSLPKFLSLPVLTPRPLVYQHIVLDYLLAAEGSGIYTLNTTCCGFKDSQGHALKGHVPLMPVYRLKKLNKSEFSNLLSWQIGLPSDWLQMGFEILVFTLIGFWGFKMLYHGQKLKHNAFTYN